jgi:twinkle protein
MPFHFGDVMDFSKEEKDTLVLWAKGVRRGPHRIQCPACSPTRRNQKAQCLSITVEHDHIVMKCHHCEREGAAKLNEAFIPPKVETFKKGAVKRLDTALTEAGLFYLSSRAISEKTALAFNLVSSKAFFPELRREEEAVAFPYLKGHKFKSTKEKAFVCDQPLSSLFGQAEVDFSESTDLIICEGELDPLSFYEAGVVNGTSVPNGSSSFTKSNDDGTMREQMGFLWEARELIDKAKRIIIATDADAPGEKIADELSRRIGRHRCWQVKYPEDCKDANDVLMKHGADALKACYDNCVPWPIDGLFEAEKYFPEVDELFDKGFAEKVSTGMVDVDQLFSVSPGLLTVVTGIPGNGKSTFVDQIMVNLARQKEYVSAICSFENPPAVHIGKLMQMLYQKHFFPTEDPGPRMDRKEVEAIKPFVHRHFKFLQATDGKKVTPSSIIERIKTAVFRWGVQIVVIDPYNYIARPEKAESETQFIDDLLTELRLVASLYGVHIFFVAHPTKMPMDSEGNYQPPKGYSISGSSAWFSKPDFGLTVHRVPNTNKVKIVNWKTRYDWLGKVGETSVIYDSIAHNYQSDDFTTPWDE